MPGIVRPVGRASPPALAFPYDRYRRTRNDRMPTLARINFLLYNKRLKGALDRVSARHDRPLPAATPGDEAAVAELRRRIEALGPPPAGDDQPSERIWRRFVEQFRDAMGRDDPRAFLRWPMITKAMFVSNQPYLSIELLSLRSRRDWRRRWRPALRESPVGRPVPFWALPWSSGNLIHHAYHLAQFEARTGRQPERFPAVFEFGGGYGSMCRLFHQLGFSGRYVIYDLPQFSALQAYYLGSLGLPLVHTDGLAGADRGVVLVSDLATLEWALRWADRSRALFVATWSLSETPASVREPIMPIVSECAGALIAYWRNFGEMNNHDYFNRWGAEHPGFVWSHHPILSLPEHFYLFGTRAPGRP
jgi:hypothetical protein